MLELGEFLKQVRLEKKLTTYRVQKDGFSLSFVARVESGQNVTLETLVKYLEYLEISVVLPFKAFKIERVKRR